MLTKKELRAYLKNNHQINNDIQTIQKLLDTLDTLEMLILKNEKYITSVSISIALYAPIHNEVNLLELISLFGHHEINIKWCFPEVVKEGFPLLFRQLNPQKNDKYLLKNPHSWQHKDCFGINIPSQATYIVPDIILIPCLATQKVNQKNYRLGYGKGFYDRTLAHYQHQSIVSIGISPFHILETSLFQWEIDVFDEALDFVIEISS